MAKTNENFTFDSPGMQVWWHGTTDSGFKHIYAPSFENPFFISDDPVEAEMYMHGGYDMDSSDSQLALVLINPDALVTFDWCDQQDLDQIQSIPKIIKKVLAFKMKSTFSLIQGMTEMSLFYALGQDDFEDFKKWFKLWLEKINFAKADDVKDEDAQEVWDWIGSAKSSRDLFKIRDLTEDVDCETANGVLYELFWSQLEGTKFNSFHEKEMSENIALCDASAIKGIWSRSLDMQEASDLMKSLRSINLESYAALRNAKTPEEAEAALKVILPPNPAKQSLVEEKIIDASDDLWVNGTTLQRWNPKTKMFRVWNGGEAVETLASISHPIFFTNDINYAVRYAEQHLSKDYANSQKNTNKFAIAYRGGNAVIVLAQLANAELFDFRDPVCFEKIGFPARFQKIFQNCEPYFSFNSNVRPNSKLNLRPQEFINVQKFLKWTESQQRQLKRKTPLKKAGVFGLGSAGAGRDAFIDLIENLDLKSTSVEVGGGGADPKYDIRAKWSEFYQAFIDAVEEQGGVEEVPGKDGGVSTWKLKNAKRENIAMLPEAPTNEQFELMEIYLQLLGWYLEKKNEIPAETVAEVRASMKDKLHADYTDLLQLFLHWKIAQHYKGFYCPEYRGGETSSPDAIGIFDQSLILKAETAECSDVNQALNEIKYPEWYRRPKLDIKTQNEMLKALKQILEEKRALQA